MFIINFRRMGVHGFMQLLLNKQNTILKSIIMLQYGLVRHYEVAVAQPTPSTDLSVRIICCLTFLLSIILVYTVGRKVKQTSDKYYLRTTPPDCYFRIWPFIFLGSMGCSIYVAINDGWNIQLWIYIAIFNILCSLWAFVFNFNTPLGLVLTGFCLCGNAIANQFLWIGLSNLNKSVWGLQSTTGIILRNIYSFAQGWLVAAAALSLSMILVYTLNFKHKTQLIIFWVAAPLVYAGVIALNIWTTGRIIDTIGIFFSMTWAVSGAMTKSLRAPEVKDEEQK